MVGQDTIGQDIIDEALAEDRGPVIEAMMLVDEGLSKLQSRELVSAGEVADLLLDVRQLLSSAVSGDEGAHDVLSAN